MGCGTLAALGLTAAGAGTQYYAAQKEKSAMNDVANQSLTRQRGFTDKARNVFGANEANSTPEVANQQQRLGAQQYLNSSQQAQLPQLGQPALQGNQAKNISFVGQDAKNALGQQANANLQGYNNVGLQRGIGNLRSGSQLGVIGNQAQQWANILPYQLQAAQNSQQGLAGIGSLLGTVGTLAGLYGLTAAPTAAQSANMAGNASVGAQNLALGTPLWMGQVAPQVPSFYNFSTGFGGGLGI